jgi:hypothetical protein
MHGLDPCIHGRLSQNNHRRRRLDARLEAGHDGSRRPSPELETPRLDRFALLAMTEIAVKILED